jgi:hypothetical protein
MKFVVQRHIVKHGELAIACSEMIGRHSRSICAKQFDERRRLFAPLHVGCTANDSHNYLEQRVARRNEQNHQRQPISAVTLRVHNNAFRDEINEPDERLRAQNSRVEFACEEDLHCNKCRSHEAQHHNIE